MAEKELFDFKHLLDEFTASKTPEHYILMEHYVNAFNDLSRFFVLMGTAFGFVSKDINEKVGILKAHRAENPDHFVTIQSMVAYEVENNLTQAKTPSGLLSGSRTLLRLHRTMDFVAKFLGRLQDMKDDEYTSKPAAEEYNRSLGKFHPWMIRKIAGLAMYTLPTRAVFIRKYCKQEKEELEKLVGPTAAIMTEIADITQQLYTDNDLLDLP
ncbi:ceramide-1-phosphate transfer protein-like [Patiria miniata]|uniref:Glycolipid transfer protein domain-containing protein n=1 Tax=Patiria miniata TaxID=46514 RepID=A0A913ZP74_PATMI|nr:ceramide-1-phosphate transfer protein-like [Patiria miniata]